MIKINDYVLAGDKEFSSQNPWAVGFLARIESTNNGMCYIVKDDKGQFLPYPNRPYFFKRVKRIAENDGHFLCENAEKISQSSRSLFFYLKARRAEWH